MDTSIWSEHRLNRRRFLCGGVTLAGLSVLAGCGVTPLQPSPASLRRVAFLADAQDDTQVAQLLEGLRLQGYVEGENLVFERRYARSDYSRFPALIAELEDLKVECIVCGGLIACEWAKRSNTPTPLVSWQVVTDVIDAGLVQNIAHPEGNMTGTAGTAGLQFHAKLLETLHEAAPGARRVGVLAYARQPSLDVMLDGLKEAARQLGLQVEVATVDDASGIESAFQALTAAGARALLVIIALIFLTTDARPRIAELARAYRLPSASPDSAFPMAGGLIAYSPNRPDVSHRVAWYVDRILKGAKPADLPMERPGKYDFIINLKTAQELGVVMPQSMLAQATQIIE